MSGFASLSRAIVAVLSVAAAPLLIAMMPAALSPAPAAAFQRVQKPPKPEMMENCPGLVAAQAARLPAALRLTLASDQVRFTYVGHSTFLIIIRGRAHSDRLQRLCANRRCYRTLSP